MIVKTFIEPPIENNNYLLIDEDSREAALIDCSAPNIWERVPKDKGTAGASYTGENRGEIPDITLKYILLTHGHFDHVAGLREGNAKIVMHKADLNWLNNVNQYMPMFNMPSITIPQVDIFIEEGNTITLGKNEIKVLHTPGHTQGGVCYYTKDILFSGDTIFRESVGRCDLDGGDFDQLVNSINTKIFTLPEETKIYPGHGKPTTVGWEKQHNNFL